MNEETKLILESLKFIITELNNDFRETSLEEKLKLMGKIDGLLNPKINPTIKERTHDALTEYQEKFGGKDNKLEKQTHDALSDNSQQVKPTTNGEAKINGKGQETNSRFIPEDNPQTADNTHSVLSETNAGEKK